MRVQVVHSDGRREVLSIVGPLQVLESTRANGMSKIVDATGMEHWFNDSDGSYDGWGRAFNPPVPLSESDGVEEMIEQVEESREML